MTPQLNLLVVIVQHLGRQLNSVPRVGLLTLLYPPFHHRDFRAILHRLG
jgi:hypothetical protein